jgi:hypothetical protein
MDFLFLSAALADTLFSIGGNGARTTWASTCPRYRIEGYD